MRAPYGLYRASLKNGTTSDEFLEPNVMEDQEMLVSRQGSRRYR